MLFLIRISDGFKVLDVAPDAFRWAVSPSFNTQRIRDQHANVAESEVVTFRLVAKLLSADCPSVCPTNVENANGTDLDSGIVEAVQAVMSLPLSDAKKAEAVRRLMKSESASPSNHQHWCISLTLRFLEPRS